MELSEAELNLGHEEIPGIEQKDLYLNYQEV